MIDALPFRVRPSCPVSSAHPRRSSLHLTLALALLALSAAVPLGGCDKGDPDTSPPGAGASTGGKDVTIDLDKPFGLPSPDLSKRPPAIRDAISRVLEQARTAPDDTRLLGELGMTLFVFRDDEAAARCFKEAARREPEEFRWPYYLGIALANQDAKRQAIEAFEQAVKVGDAYSAAHTRLGDLLYATGSPKAEETYRKTLDIELRSARAAYGLGMCLKNKGQRDEAIAQMQRAIELFPAYADAHGALAEMLQAAGKPDEAAPHVEAQKTGSRPEYANDPLYNDMIERGRTPEVLTEMGVLRTSEGRLREAIETLQAAIRLRSDYAPARRALGDAWAAVGRQVEAEVEYRKALELAPDDLEAKSALGDCLIQLKRQDEAGRLFAEVLAAKPDHAPTLWRQGRLRRIENKLDEAIALMQRSVESDPRSIYGQYYLAETLFAADRLEDARAQVDKLLELSPENPRGLYMKGWILKRAGDRAGARQQWEQSIKNAPAYVEAYMQLAGLLVDDKKAGEVETLLREGLKHAPDSAELNNALGWRLAVASDPALRKPSEAMGHAEKACQLTNHSEPMFLDTLAAAYAAMGRYDDAVSASKAAIKLANEAGQTALAADIQTRLVLFEQKTAYNEPE